MGIFNFVILKMTIGIDLGSKFCVTSVARRNLKSMTTGNFVDTVLDESSKRMISNTIGFPDRERTFGNIAQKQSVKNIEFTIINPLQYLGKSYDEAIKLNTFNVCQILPNNFLTLCF